MAHHTKAAGFPQIPLQSGMKIRIRALSPTTDAEVTGVTCTQFAIYGRDKSGGLPLEDAVPDYVPEEVYPGST
jgi:hypothetical protein